MKRNHQRLWRLTLLFFAAIFSGTLLLSDLLADTGVHRILRLAAARNVDDWLRHIRQDHRLVISALRDGTTLPSGLVTKLRREARQHHLISFQLRAIDGRVILSSARSPARPAEPKLRWRAAPLPPTNAMPSAASEGKPDGALVSVSRPLRTRQGVIGRISAVVDVRALGHAVEDWIYSLVAAAAVGVLLMISLASWLFRRISRDSHRHLQRIAKHDELTGLPNRRRCLEDIARRLDRNGEAAARFVFMLLDIENFGRVASMHGHLAAERLLKIVADRLRDVAGDAAAVYRFDSDSFGILVTQTEKEAPERLAAALLAAANRPVGTPWGVLHPSAVLGGVIVPDDADTVEQIVRRATLVCWAAMRRTDRTPLFYTRDIEAAQARNGHLERLVKSALRDNRLQMHFQPVVHMDDGRIHGFEALLRMHDENGRAISPEEFIPVAEQYGMMEEIGVFALLESCRVAAGWPQHLKVAVNLSPLQFESGKLVSVIEQALQLTGLPPQRLELEVTENLMLDDCLAVLTQLRRLKEMGVRIVLDDFGTGYSSLSYLWRFPFDKIKIDRSFIADMDRHPDVRTVLRAILAMARGMRLPVTAEGIEKPHQAAWLREFGCDFGQGWLFGRPVPEQEVVQIILADRRRAEGASERKPHAPPTPDAIAG